MEYEGRLPKEGINTSSEHPLRELALLLGGFVAVAVAVTLLAALLVDRLVPLLPPDLEVRLFASWLSHAVLAEEDADPRRAGVQALLERMAGHWSGHPYDFRVGVIPDAETNAFALPGGWIFVTSGLLDRAASENELALVLGHELGHYHARDHLRGLGRGVALTAVLAALGSDVAGSLASLGVELTARRFGRDQERAADAFGLALLHAEYGHVAGADALFARMAASEDAGGTGRFAAYLSTHPLHAQRVDALRAHAQAQGWSGDGALRPLVWKLE